MSAGISSNGQFIAGDVRAYTTQGRGLNVEEIADMALRRLVHIADTAPPELREQAFQFKANIRRLLIEYMHQAIKSDRTTLYNNLKGSGFPEVAEIVLKL